MTICALDLHGFGVTTNCPAAPLQAMGADHETLKTSPAKTTVRELVFEGVNKLPAIAMEEIASAAKNVVYDHDPDWLADLSERVRNSWREYGYFDVCVTARSVPISTHSDSIDVAVSMHVDEGEQYRLGDISFVNAKQYSVDSLRSLFSLNTNDIFNPRLVQQGLDKLRQRYGSQGFINFTAVPEIATDKQQRLIFLMIDVSEGPQFHIAEIAIKEDDHGLINKALHESKIEMGEVFSTERWEKFRNKVKSLLPSLDPEDLVTYHVDADTATVSLAIDGTALKSRFNIP